MLIKHVRVYFATLVCVGSVLTGCVQQYTNPNQIQSGGLVEIGLGGIKRNALSNTLTTSDLTVTIKDRLNHVYPIRPLSLFRVYPDYASAYSIQRLDPTNGLPVHANTLPYDGGWYLTALLQDEGGYPLALATGDATISVTSPKLVNLKANSEGDLTKIKVKIIAGTTSPSYEQTEQFNYYKPKEHLTLRPSTTTGVSVVGGATIKITYDNTVFAAAVPPQVVPTSHDPNIQLIKKVTDNGNGTSTITVSLSNPNGFVSAANWSVNKGVFDDLNLMVVPQSGLDADWAQHISVDTAQSFYVDLDGNTIAGLTPVLAVGLMDGEE